MRAEPKLLASEQHSKTESMLKMILENVEGKLSRIESLEARLEVLERMVNDLAVREA